MDQRIETIATTATDLVADTSSRVIASAAKLVARLLENMDTLTGSVIRDATEVAVSACEVFLPEDYARKS